MFPLYEYEEERYRLTYRPSPIRPVEEYIKGQGRFRHLFEPTVQTDAIAHIQKRVNTYWEQVKQAEKTA